MSCVDLGFTFSALEGQEEYPRSVFHQSFYCLPETSRELFGSQNSKLLVNQIPVSILNYRNFGNEVLVSEARCLLVALRCTGAADGCRPEGTRSCAGR